MPTTRRYRYEYDLPGRLTDVYRDGALTEHYEYGANGMRTSATKGATTVSATYDAQDRLTSPTAFTWTPAGRLSSKGSTGYTYDGRGNLMKVMGTSVGTIENEIDPLTGNISGYPGRVVP